MALAGLSLLTTAVGEARPAMAARAPMPRQEPVALTPGFNGSVRALALAGGRVIGPRGAGGAILDGRSGGLLAGSSRVGGDVVTAIADGRGGWYVGGRDSLETSRALGDAPGLLHLDASGRQDR